MNKVALDYLSDMHNRSERQTEFLFGLCKHDYNKLCDLEDAIRTNFVFYCPDTEQEVNELLNKEK